MKPNGQLGGKLGVTPARRHVNTLMRRRTATDTTSADTNGRLLIDLHVGQDNSLPHS